jgi:flagellar motor switch protein FliM
MTTPEIANSVFSEPRRLTGEANRALMGWQSSFCSILGENWQGLLGSHVSLTLDRTSSGVAGAAIAALADPGYGVRLEVGGAGFPSLFAFSSRLVQTLVFDMLGTPGEEWPELRDLTPAELSMAELLFGEIARAVSQAWPEIEPLQCELHSVISRPMRSRLFSPDEPIVQTTITVNTPFGPDDMVWVSPRSGLESIGIRDASTDGQPFQPDPQMRNLARLIPVELVIELGNTSLSLRELNELQVGDYLPLDQPVYQPLEAMVDGQLQWLGTPCRLGNRQGFQILATRKGAGS